MHIVLSWLQDEANGQILTAIGILISAAISTTALCVSILSSRKQNIREQNARRPNVIVTRVTLDETGFTTEILNLGTVAIYISLLAHDNYDAHRPEFRPNLLIKAGSTGGHRLLLADVPDPRGEFRLFFRYGLTGPVYHRLSFNYSIPTELLKARRSVGLNDTMRITVSNQRLTIGTHIVQEDDLLTREKFS